MSKNNIAGFAIGDRANKTADGQDRPVISRQITVTPPTRRSSDLTDWRNANKSAESLIPRRSYLYDLYHDYGTTDAQIIAAWQKRVDPVLSANWEFTDKTGEVVEDIQQLLDCTGFEDLLSAIMESKRDGYKMVEPKFFINDNGQNEFSLYVVPLKNMRPELGVIAYSHLGDDGLNIREGIYAKTVMEFGKTDDLGLMLSACMYAILKRGDISDWAEFIEIFGRGIIDATWDGFDLKQRQELVNSIREMGGGGIILRPAGTTVDIKNNTGNANGDLQDKFAKKMDGYISKLFLGSTETMDSSDTSGYAQSKTHKLGEEEKNLTDLNFVRRYLNSRFIKVLKAWGLDTREGTFVLKQKKNINKEAFEIHKTMRKELGVPLDDDFFYEEYGARKPENYEQLKKEALERRNAVSEEENGESNADTPPSKEKAKSKTPTNNKEELSIKPTLWRRLLRLFHPAPVLEQMPIAGAAHNCGDHLTIKLAAFAADAVFDQLADGLINRAWDAAGKLEFDAELFNYTASALTRGFIHGWGKQPVKLADLGFEYGFDDPNILTAYEMNLFRFAGVKTLYEAQQLNELFRKSKSFKEFYDSASSILKVHNRTWLEAEYNTAIATGESAATYARLLKQVDIFPYWEYKTVGDNKVRHSHELLEGVILPWNSPLWRYIMTPNDWNCRCFIVPRTKAEVTAKQLKDSESRVKAYLSSEAFKRAAKGGWGINRANKGMVFTENQHYATDYLDALGKLDKINFEAYNLDALKVIFEQQRGSQFKPMFSVDEKEQAIERFFAQAEKASAKKYQLTDFNNRQILISKSTVRVHTADSKAKYKDRHQYLELLPDILKSPDEVWLNNYNSQLNNYVYVKYYKDVAINVVARLNNVFKLEIESWFTIENDQLRKGLLIKN